MKGLTLKKTIITALLATTLIVPSAFAQMTQEERNAKAFRQLVDQYATSTLGFLIEDRCRQLAQVGYDDFIANQKILNAFMSNLMGEAAWQNLLVGIDQTAQDAETNPCNSDTFKFSLATSQISSKMATRVQLLDPEDYPNPFEEIPVAQAETQNQGSTPPAQQAPAQQSSVQVEPEPVETPPPPPKTTFEPLTTTQVDRQKVAEKPQSQEAITGQQQPPPPQTSTRAQTQTTQPAQQQAGISLSNYVNPYPYSPAAAPGGETEKVMKRRHRQEIIDLRRAQRAELDAYKDNSDNYIDGKAVKKAIEQRQSAEYTAIRNRHQQELDRF